MALPYKYFTVNVSDLLLDVKNPRFASSTLVDNASKVPNQNKTTDLLCFNYKLSTTLFNYL